jgi:hypothetical protein
MGYHTKKSQRETIMFRTYIIAILIMIVIVYGIYRLIEGRATTQAIPQAALAEFAQCLTDHGVKLYGTFWCPHCQRQKALFGDAVELINYVECTVDGRRDLLAKECQTAGIDSFPTWIFGDGSRQSGELSFAELAERSGCLWESSASQSN